jgi:hypothetical protein
MIETSFANVPKSSENIPSQISIDTSGRMMTSENQGRSAADPSNIMEVSDLEEITSATDEEPTQREMNDRRLAQAINYLEDEGGDDSPATFMDRVDRIDDALLLPLFQQGRNFNVNLWNRVQAMVSQAQLDFDEAAQGQLLEEDLSSMSNGESPVLERAEELPEYLTPSAAQALHRKDGRKEKPRPKDSVREPAEEKEEKVRREQKFQYGGPNEVERWYKDYPASLPFPETFQLEHWESLKIDYDLNQSVKQMKAEGKIVETNLSFDHPALKQYRNLSMYESGSRFKLPKVSESVQKRIDRIGTPERLKKTVEKTNETNNKLSKYGKYLYAPRVFLEKLTVGDQGKQYMGSQ